MFGDFVFVSVSTLTFQPNPKAKRRMTTLALTCRFGKYLLDLTFLNGQQYVVKLEGKGMYVMLGKGFFIVAAPYY